MNRRGETLLLLLLLGAATLLGLALARQLGADAIPVPTPSPPRGTTAPVPQPPAPRREVPPIGRFAAVTERPLFTPGRRPRTAGGAATDGRPGPAGAGRWLLSGIVTADGETLALVKRAGSNEPARRLAEGELLDGWRVVAIGADSVRLERGGASNVLKLSDNRPATPPPVKRPPPRKRPPRRK